MELYLKTFELLERTGLNWTVEREPLITADGRATETFGLFRSDSRKWLGSVGPQYEVMQNSTLAETMVDAASTVGLEVNRGGSLAEGRKVYFQCALPDAYVGRSGLKRNITALNSHDGTTSIAFGTTSTVVICQNTFHRAMKSGDLQRFRHTATAKERLQAALTRVKAALQEEATVLHNFQRMAAVDLRDEMAEGLISRIIKKGMSVNTDKVKDLSTRKRNQLLALDSSISRELRDEGATLWGLFNGVTRYTNHVAAPDNGKLGYVMTGSGHTLNNLAYDQIMAWIDANVDNSLLVPVA